MSAVGAETDKYLAPSKYPLTTISGHLTLEIMGERVTASEKKVYYPRKSDVAKFQL